MTHDDPSTLVLRDRDNGVSLSVRAKPRAARDRVEGVSEGVLVVAVRAAPVEGEANAALVGVLCSFFKVSRRAVTITHGLSGRNKSVLIEGVDAATVRQRLTEG